MSRFKDKTSEVNKKIGTMFIAMRRSDTPLYAKIACGMLVWYVLSPVDVIPDFIPVLGMVDDFVILPFLMALCVSLMPEEIMEECSAQAEEIWASEGKQKFVYAIPILLFWCLIFFFLAKLIIKYV